MSDAIIVAIITGLFSVAGIIITTRQSNRKVVRELEKHQTKMEHKFEMQQALTDQKIEELTREVRTHNNFAQRMPVVEEQIKTANHRIEDLESFHKHA